MRTRNHVTVTLGSTLMQRFGATATRQEKPQE